MAIWPFRRRRPSRATTAARKQLEAAQQELEAAKQDLEAVRGDDAQVAEVAGKLRRLAQRNHFGPMISAALRGSK